MNKKIYSAKYITQVEYDKAGLFSFTPKRVKGTSVVTSSIAILASSPEEALDRFKDISESNFERMMEYLTFYEHNLVILKQEIEVFEISDFHSLNELMKKMPSKDFIEYCKQEFYEIDDVLMGQSEI